MPIDTGNSTVVSYDWDSAIPWQKQHQDPDPTLAFPVRAYLLPTAWQLERPNPSQHTEARTPALAALGRDLLESLDILPIEDCCGHSAERIMDEMLLAGDQGAKEIGTLYRGNVDGRPSLSAGILRLVGRIERGLALPWGLEIVKDAIKRDDLEVRDAAVRALEKWGGPLALDILRAALTNETVSWMREYIRGVITDLSA